MSLKKFYDATNVAEAQVQSIASQINDLFELGKTDEALALRPQLDKARADAHEAQQLYISMQAASLPQEGSDPARRFVPTGGDAEPKMIKDLRASPEYMAQFINALKEGATPKNVIGGRNAEKFGLLMDALSTTGGSPAGEEGGFLNPVDFDDKIHERMRQFVDLATPAYFNVEEVSAYSGWRAIETATAEYPFDELTELEVLADEDETESPTFSKIEYTVVDYGGFLRVSNSLMADTPVNLLNYLARWFGKKIVLTNNSLILALINAIDPTAVTDYTTLLGAIKTALNKTLDPAVSARAKIFTNQSGFDLLDQLDDGVGRPLLQPDPSNVMMKRVIGREVVVLSDAHWPLDSGDALMAIGDGTEYATFFRRAAFEMASTSIGGSAWRSNSTEVRGIMRADAVEMDDEAMVLLAITLP